VTLVLVVDDQDLVRAGLAALLRAAPNGYTVHEARDGFEAVRMTAEHSPDVILMDIRMPGMDGITAIRVILAEAEKERREPPRILVLTTFDLDEHVHDALRAGASGFLVKNTPAARLFAAVDAVAAGDMAFTQRLVEAFQQKHDSLASAKAHELNAGPEPSTTARRPSAELTSRELDVLRMVGTGLSNTDIAAELMLAEATVKTHIYRVMTKLNLASRAQVVVYAYETGLVTPGSLPE
jgi:DNA-binding NarL/FixJ family response regulator